MGDDFGARVQREISVQLFHSRRKQPELKGPKKTARVQKKCPSDNRRRGTAQKGKRKEGINAERERQKRSLWRKDTEKTQAD